MHTPKRHLTNHRIQRLILWTIALLAWLQALLDGDTKRFDFRKWRQRRGYIAWLAQLTQHFIILRACRLARLRRPKHKSYGPTRMRRHLIRSVLGSRLRARLKHRTAHEAVAKLIDALRNIDVHAQHLAQRLKRGLTRLDPITSLPTDDALHGARASLVRRSFSEGGQPAFANSS